MELLPQAKTKSQRSHFQVPRDMLSCLIGSSCFVVDICWVVSYQWLGSGVVVCFPAVPGSGHQGWCEMLMVKCGVQHFFRAVPVSGVAVLSLVFFLWSTGRPCFCGGWSSMRQVESVVFRLPSSLSKQGMTPEGCLSVLWKLGGNWQWHTLARWQLAGCEQCCPYDTSINLLR